MLLPAIWCQWAPQSSDTPWDYTVVTLLEHSKCLEFSCPIDDGFLGISAVDIAFQIEICGWHARLSAAAAAAFVGAVPYPAAAASR